MLALDYIFGTYIINAMNLKSYLTKTKIYLARQKTRMKISKEKQLALSLALLLIIFCTPVALGQYQQNPQANQDVIEPGKEIDVSTEDKKTEMPAPETTPSPEEKTPQPTPTKTPLARKSTTRAVSNPKPAYNQSSPNQAQASAPTPSKPASNSTTAPTPQSSGILGLINQARLENGLNALVYNSSLNSAAKSKSQDMLDKNYFSHTSPDGVSDFDFLRAVGYSFRFAGSNIAKGSFSEASVFNAWMNSAGHRANILNSNAREFGYGVAGQYYTMFVADR